MLRVVHAACCCLQVESFFAVLQPIIAAAGRSSTPTQQAGIPPEPAELPQQQQQQQWRLHIVDFGCGTGNLLLPLAALFPCCNFTGVDMKPAALQLLQQRAAAAGLSNVAVFAGMIEQYTQPFDVALALHACGNATDHVLQMAVHRGAAFVVSPCCVGERG
jgi:2-polyprenyl-3-methyl-5-hydroxy-6-metoxy-1,4-benzoquinol methylase